MLFFQVAKPNIGERSPAVVRADVTINLNTRPDIRAEWEGNDILSFFALGKSGWWMESVEVTTLDPESDS